MDGWMDTQLQQQIHMDNVEKLQSPVPNPSLWQEIPETSKGIILGVRQRLQIWQVWGIFNCLNKHINKICSLAGFFFFSSWALQHHGREELQSLSCQTCSWCSL